MKLSAVTVDLLTNFSQINEGILIKPGSTLRTISKNKAVFAEATIDEVFEKGFGVYDLNKLLGVLSLVNEPEVVLGETSLEVGSGKTKTRIRYTDAKLIVTPPDKNINPPYTIKFDLSAADLATVFKMASILSVPNIVFNGEDGKLTCSAIDVKGELVDDASIDIGETNATFKAVLKVENLRLLPGDYEIEVSPRGVVKFANKKLKVTYWCALESATSKF